MATEHTEIIPAISTQAPPALMDHFPFFRLPGELRSNIYELALHHPPGLVGDLIGDCVIGLYTFNDSPDNTYQLANRLQHVSRQMRQETKNFEIRNNHLIFMPNEYCCPVNQFGWFVKRLSAEEQKYVRSVTLRAIGVDPWRYLVWSNKMLKRIYQFCSNNPKCTVRLHLPTLGYDYPNNLLLVTHAIAKFTKDRDDVLSKITTDTDLQQELLDLNTIIGGHDHNLLPRAPPNLKFFPFGEEFDELKFRQQCGYSGLFSRLVFLAGGTDHWVALAKEIYKNGI